MECMRLSQAHKGSAHGCGSDMAENKTHRYTVCCIRGILPTLTHMTVVSCEILIQCIILFIYLFTLISNSSKQCIDKTPTNKNWKNNIWSHVQMTQNLFIPTNSSLLTFFVCFSVVSNTIQKYVVHYTPSYKQPQTSHNSTYRQTQFKLSSFTRDTKTSCLPQNELLIEHIP